MNVPESAFALLDVRFPQIDRTAVFPTRRNPLGDLFMDERGGLPVKDLALHGSDKGIVEYGISGDKAGFKERGPDLDVLPRERHAFIDGPNAVSHVHAGVPEHVQQLQQSAAGPFRPCTGT